jgi:hypothetical protein
MQVYALSRWINRNREIIPVNTIEKPPSAELRPGQVDQDSLPPYEQLDAILRGYVEEGLSRRDLIAQGFAETVVNDIARKVDLNEYKRKQSAPGLKITPLAFGVGRRIPIVLAHRDDQTRRIVARHREILGLDVQRLAQKLAKALQLHQPVGLPLRRPRAQGQAA